MQRERRWGMRRRGRVHLRTPWWSGLPRSVRQSGVSS